ncbi:MAG: hypothetical protein AB2A00_17810 [Myxococcota bacterium]
MELRHRQPYNKAFNQALFERFRTLLSAEVGPVPFRLAETPLFISRELRDLLARNAVEIVGRLSEPQTLKKLKAAIPGRYAVPGMDALPNCVQVDFALCPAPGGGLMGQVVELQAFPSLYALMEFKTRAWNQVLADVPELKKEWSCYAGLDDDEARRRIGRMIVGGEDPEHVALVDITPEKQKTSPDFEATRKLFGVESVCVTKIIKEGRKLFREKDGKRIPIKRIYNRMVFDELEAKQVTPPWNWNEELDVTWCSHPNWYWTFSKYSLPAVEHAAIPKTSYLSDLKEIPQDLHNYVLKPLFSFAGTGVKVDVTRADVDAVPERDRHAFILQRKVEYAHALQMPDGTGVKAEVRVMLARAPDETAITPVLCLVRLSRGKMIGVDHNKDLAWTGGTVGIWPADGR